MSRRAAAASVTVHDDNCKYHFCNSTVVCSVVYYAGVDGGVVTSSMQNAECNKQSPPGDLQICGVTSS